MSTLSYRRRPGDESMVTASRPQGSFKVPAVGGARRIKEYHDFLTMGVLVGAHIVGALAMQQVRILSTVHALVVLALGVRFAINPRRRDKAIFVLSYIATSDVLWRMTRAAVFWEFGKYSLVLIFLLLLARGRRHPGLTPLAVSYWLLLMPSVALTVVGVGLSNDLRRALSFNLSGPLALTLAVVYFSGYSGRQLPLAKMLAWAIYPVVGCFSIALSSTLTATQLNFGNFANFATSGGFGPNQVSSILGLGVFFCLVLAIKISDPWLRLLNVGLAAALGFQAVLTFSRGGTFNIVVAMGLFGFHSLTNPRVRRGFFLIAVVAGMIGTFLLFPRLNDWTQGMVSKRFTSFDTTGRQSLMEADVRLFMDNPALGVGPGQSARLRRGAFQQNVASHTEFTRLLAEHGTLGVAALLLICIIVVKAYQLAPTLVAKGWVASFAAWTLANMAHSGMRLAAMSFVFGLATLPFHRWRRQQRDATRGIRRV